MALQASFPVNADVFVCEIPPALSDVFYSDRQNDPLRSKVIQAVVAYITNLDHLTAGLVFFIPSLTAHESTVTMWNAMMDSLALHLFIGFVPIFFAIFFSLRFVLTAQAWLQHHIQNWYFWFRVV